MNTPELSELRRKLDDAITYDDIEAAGRLADEGLKYAQQHELLAEIMYFRINRDK